LYALLGLEVFFSCCAPPCDFVSEPEPPVLEPSEADPAEPEPSEPEPAPLSPLVDPVLVEPALDDVEEALAEVAVLLALLTPGSGLKGLRVAPPAVCWALPLVVSATGVFVLAAAVTAIPEAFGTATGVLAAGAGTLEPPPIAA
jgi:hypothetical protein